MALTAERLWSRASHPVPVLQRLPVNGTSKVYRGDFLGDDGDLGHHKAVVVADGTTTGLAEETVDNTTGADGAKYVLAILSCRLWIPVTAFDPSNAYDGDNDINKIVYWDPANNRFTSVSASMVNIGKVDSYEPAGASNPAGFWVNYKARQVRDV